MTNKILVTGASGNIAQSLLPLLQEKGADFTCMLHSEQLWRRQGFGCDGHKQGTRRFDRGCGGPRR